MELKAGVSKLSLLALVSILVGGAVGYGPTVISNKPGEIRVASGRATVTGSNLSGERNFIRYTLRQDETPLSRKAAKRMADGFGVSVDAIFNANPGQREKDVMKTDSNQVRIPLQPEVRTPLTRSQ